MANSKITITFLEVPMENRKITFTESTLALTFDEIFREHRSLFGQTALPHFQPEDELHEDRWIGNVATFYKEALDLDYNTTGNYSIVTTLGPLFSGIGTIVITANYPNAFFSVVSNTSGAIITVENDHEEPEVPIEKMISPSLLEFEAFTNTPDVPSKVVEITTDELWTIISSPPSWLEILPLTGNGISISTFKVSNYSAVAPNNYSVPIIFKLGDEEFTVTVNFKLKENKTVVSPYEPNKVAFTLDQKNFTIQSENLDTYFQFNSTITVYKFFINDSETTVIPQKALLFKGKTQINLGKLVHRLMNRFETVNNFENQYKLANLDIECTELNNSDATIIGVTNLSNIKFVAGISKDFNNYGFLEFNQKPTRVTTQGYYFLNILIPAGNFELRTYKNGQIINTKQLPTNTQGPICEKVSFENYFQGDQIEFKIDVSGQSNESTPNKVFYIFPEQLFSNVIVWENEYLLQSSFEFTNHHDIKMDLERQSSKVFNGFVEKTINHSVSKENKLSINTGWITKNDIDSLESLLLSKRAFIQIGNRIVDLVPSSKTLTNVDTSQDLYDYTFEFSINKKYNEETYTS